MQKWKDNLLLVKDQDDIPNICLGCSSREQLQPQKLFLDHVTVGSIIGALIFPIRWLFIPSSRIKARINILLCSKCHIKYSRWSTLLYFGMGVVVLAVFANLTPLSEYEEIIKPALLSGLSFSIVAGLFRSPKIKVDSYSKPYFYLKGIDDNVKSKTNNA